MRNCSSSVVLAIERALDETLSMETALFMKVLCISITTLRQSLAHGEAFLKTFSQRATIQPLSRHMQDVHLWPRGVDLGRAIQVCWDITEAMLCCQ